MLQIPHISRRVYPGTQFWRSGRISGRATSRPHVRRSGFEVSPCCVQPSGAALGRAGVTLRGELSVQTLKHGVGTVIGTEPQDPAPGVFDHAPSLEHDFLHHRLHAPSLGRMAQWRVFANERILTNQAQDVHCQRSHCTDRGVGVKLTAGQTLQVHVGFEFTMELLVRGVVFVQINDAHPRASRIHMIQGSSVAPEVVQKVKDFAKGYSRVLVILDSNHTHDRVLAELEAYALLISVGSYCVVFDTVIEDMPKEMLPNRPWGPGDNPKTAVWKYLETHKEFEIDKSIQDKLLITVVPDGYLRRLV
jgi:hypothetical protein